MPQYRHKTSCKINVHTHIEVNYIPTTENKTKRRDICGDTEKGRNIRRGTATEIRPISLWKAYKPKIMD